jgi:hypothetical protein
VIVDLQPRVGPRIERLQLNGDDLALDRVVATINADTMHPISVIFEESALSPDEEGKVARVLEAIGGSRSRGEVVAALEGNGWDEPGAISGLFDERRRSPAARTSRFLPPAATDAPAARLADPSQDDADSNRMEVICQFAGS